MLNPKSGKKWKVFVAVPSGGTISDFQPFIMRELVERYSDEIEFLHAPQLCQRIFHDAARNGLVEDFLASGADIMWMLDSDVCPTRHVLDLVTVHGDKWLCAGAPYPVFMAQPNESVRQLVFTCYKKMAGEGPVRLAPCNIPPEGTEFIDGIATGCLMIKREVFDRLERPFFEFKYDPITRAPIEGEDIGFCLKMAKLGIQFFVDYSMCCKHYKNNIDLLEINNYAISYAQKCVDYQANVVKGDITLIQEQFDKLKEQNKAMKAFIADMEKEFKRGGVRMPSGQPTSVVYR